MGRFRLGHNPPLSGRESPDAPKDYYVRKALASATVTAVMLTSRRTVADGVRMCTGLPAPNRTGPIAIPPPAACFNKLYAMLALSMFGSTSRLASPLSVERGINSLR